MNTNHRENEVYIEIRNKILTFIKIMPCEITKMYDRLGWENSFIIGSCLKDLQKDGLIKINEELKNDYYISFIFLIKH